MEETIEIVNDTLLEMYDQMVTLEKLLRDLTMVLKQNEAGYQDLASAINNAVGMIA